VSSVCSNICCNPVSLGERVEGIMQDDHSGWLKSCRVVCATSSCINSDAARSNSLANIYSPAGDNDANDANDADGMYLAHLGDMATNRKQDLSHYQIRTLLEHNLDPETRGFALASKVTVDAAYKDIDPYCIDRCSPICTTIPASIGSTIIAASYNTGVGCAMWLSVECAVFTKMLFSKYVVARKVSAIRNTARENIQCMERKGISDNANDKLKRGESREMVSNVASISELCDQADRVVTSQPRATSSSLEVHNNVYNIDDEIL